MAQPHYHVEAFMPGCLNDYDSGPCTTLKEAKEIATWYRSDTLGNWIHTGPVAKDQKDRWEQKRGLYILAIVTCDKPIQECGADAEY